MGKSIGNGDGHVKGAGVLRPAITLHGTVSYKYQYNCTCIALYVL